MRMKRDARVPGVARLNRKHFFSAFDTLKNEACKGTVWLRGFEDRDEADEADHSLTLIQPHLWRHTILSSRGIIKQGPISR